MGGLGSCFSWSLFEAFFSDLFKVKMSIGEQNIKIPPVIKLPLSLNKGEVSSPVDLHIAETSSNIYIYNIRS